MAFFRFADVDRLLARFGQPVTIASTTVNGIVDAPDETYASDSVGSLVVGTKVIRVKTGAFGSALVEGAQLTTDGVSYRVQRYMHEGDGALTVIEIAPR